MPRLSARAIAALLAACLAVGPAWPQGGGQALPALGDAASEELGISAERQLGDRIMRDLRRDPDLLDDPLLLEYVQSIWLPLVAAARERGDVTEELAQRYAWEAFLVRDRAVNAFALPGGYIGVYLGLISITVTPDELASVLAHELSHVTQRHIARSMGANRRSSLVGIAAVILGVLAASRSANVDAANALIVGGQALPAQAQLNFSRDMEREADRIGQSVLARAGFAPDGMASMFEKLQSASRLNDNGAYAYLRSHPLTPERIGNARARLGLDAVPMGVRRGPSLLLHAAMQGRARALADGREETLRRLQETTPAPAAPGDGGAAAALLAATAAAGAAQRLKNWPRAESAYEQARRAAQGDAAAERAVALMQAELWLDRGQAAPARAALARAAADGSRAAVLLGARAALVEAAAGGATAPKAALSEAAQTLQTWVALQSADAQAWALLAQLHERLGNTLAAVRAQAEAQLALGDTAGAAERLRAGQRLGRAARSESIEVSVIDARLREVELRRRDEQERLDREGGDRP